MRINHDLKGEKSPNSKYEPLRDKNISILLNTPTKDKSVSWDFSVSLAQTSKVIGDLGIPFVILDSNNSNFTALTRNRAVTKFVNTTFSHLLQIDSDMGWNVNDLLDLFLFDKEFIGCVGRKKIDEIVFAGEPVTDYSGVVLGQMGTCPEDSLVKMKHMGGAFTLQKRSLFDKLISKYPNHKSNVFGEDIYTFYQERYEPIWTTEDYYFCDLCNNADIDVWCYPNATLKHQGIKDYSGNYLESHKKQDVLEYSLENLNLTLTKGL